MPIDPDRFVDAERRDTMTPEQRLRLIEMLNRFEADWQSRDRTRIEAVWKDAPEDLDRELLLRSLIALEVELRRRDGEVVTPSTYQSRFPDQSSAIASVFEELQEPLEGEPVFSVGEPVEPTRREPHPDVEGASEAGSTVQDEATWVQATDPSTEPFAGSTAAVASGAIDARGDAKGVAGQMTPGGRFRILRPHARGGLGEVYLARDEELGREVALKEIRHTHAHDIQSRSRFMLEAEINGNLEHPAIVPVYGLGRYEDGRPFYAMRFIDGESLQGAINAFHRESSDLDATSYNLRLRQLLTRFLDVCEAIAYAHARGVLHRDLKPSNVMLGPYGETLIIDWGLAKATGRSSVAPERDGLRTGPLVVPSSDESDLTREGKVLGTPSYMSPEQASGQKEALGPTTDIYSLGAILYAVLTGRAPVEGSSNLEVLRRVRRGEITPVSTHTTRAPKALAAVSLKALSLRVEDRYESARALAAEVERALADEPVTALPESPWQRLARWIRHHRRAALAAVISLAVITIVALVALVLIDGARRSEQRYLAKMTEAFRAANEQVVAYPGFVDDYAALHQDNPALDDLRRELLGQALDYYRRFIETYDGDPDLAPEVADAYDRLGGILADRGELAEADRAQRAAIARWEALGRSEPDDPAHRAGLALAHAFRGNQLKRAGRFREAERDYGRATGLLVQLAEEQPAVLRHRKYLAEIENALGTIDNFEGKLAEAKQHYQRAIDLYERLLSDQPRNLDYLSVSAQVQSNLGIAHAIEGRLDEAEPCFRRAVDLGERLIAEDPEDITNRTLLTGYLVNLARFCYDTTRFDESERLSRRAIALYQALEQEQPGLTKLRINHLAAASNFANMLRDIGRTAEAEQIYGEAIAMGERLIAEQPDRPQFLSQLARTHNNVGRLQEHEGRLVEAESSYTRSTELRQQIVDLQPEVDDFRRGLGLSLNSLATVLMKTGRSVEAEQRLDEAIGHFEQLASKNPHVQEHREGLAWACMKLGVVHLGEARAAEAESAMRDAVSHWRQLVADQPGASDFVNGLGGALNDLGMSLVALGREDEAVPVYREAIALQREALAAAPQVIRYREFLNTHYRQLTELLVRMGRIEEAIEAIREHLALEFIDSGTRHDAARLLARCFSERVEDTPLPDRDDLAAETVAVLRRAVEAGWADPVLTATTPDLEPLRDRDDFQRLLGGLFDRIFPEPPFAVNDP